MNFEKLFVNYERAEHLQELGLDMSNAAFCLMPYCDEVILFDDTKISAGRCNIGFYNGMANETPTYTLQEMLQCLGDYSLTCMGGIYYIDLFIDSKEVRFGARDVLTVARLALEYKLENGHLKEETK